MKKYELVNKREDGLYQVKSLMDFGNVKAGELGGWIEKESNLSHISNCWVRESAIVCENARVYGDAEVSGDARVCGSARVYGDVEVCGDAVVSGNAVVSGDAVVSGSARVYGDARVCGSARVSGDARVCGSARVYGSAEVSGDARVCGSARVLKSSDYIVFKNNLTSQRYYTYTFSNDSWKVGCFEGTTKELKEHLTYKSDSQKFEYSLAIEYVQKLKDFKLGLLQP